MEHFQREIIPFANSGSICYLHPTPIPEMFQDWSEQKFLSFASFVRENDIQFAFFINFKSGENSWESIRKQLDDSGLKTIPIQINPFPKSSSEKFKEEAICYLESVNNILKEVGSSNFLFFFPVSENIPTCSLIASCILTQDESIEIEDLLSYIATEPKPFLTDLEFLKKFIYSEFYLTYKDLKHIPKSHDKPKSLDLENVSKNGKSSLIEKAISYRSNALPFDLNLSSLDKKVTESPLSKIDKMPFNLNDFSEDVFHPEVGSNDNDLVEELMNFAESLEFDKKDDEWADAFPDTGLMVEDNLGTSNNMNILEFTEETVIPKVNAIENKTNVIPFPDVSLDSLIVDEINLDTNVFNAIGELDSDLFSEENEINIGDENKTIYVEAVLEEPTPKQTKEVKKKTPPTIIVTAEKVETIRPISGETASISNKDFNAIQLD